MKEVAAQRRCDFHLWAVWMSLNDEAATQSMPAAQNQTHPNTIALHPRRMRTLKRVCVRAAVAVPPIAAAGAGICTVRRGC